MSRDKQIEEMAEVLKGMDRLDEARFGFYESYARALYNADYRKASDVAREIFEEIFYHTYYSHGRLIIEHSTLLALQKKYESEKE